MPAAAPPRLRRLRGSSADGPHHRFPRRPRLRRRPADLAVHRRSATISANPPEETAEHEFHKHAKHARTSPATARSASSTGSSCSAASRSTRKSAPPATASTSSRSATSHELGYTEAEVKAIADQWAIEVPSVNPDTGEAATRKAIPSDRFPSALCQRDRGARGQQQCASARPVADHQGARGRRGLHLFAADRLSEASRPSCSRSSRPRRPRRACTTTPISRTSTSPCRRRSPATGR